MRHSFLTALVAAVMVFTASEANAETIHIAAAANLQTVFDKALLPAFTKATGITAVPTYGSTKLLATQIENGAPVDVFVAADKETPDRMAARGELDRSTERVYAYGKLVFWSRKDAAAPPKSPSDLAWPQYTRIAIANPRLAPYGKAAMAMIDRAHLMQALRPKVVFAENIAQTLQYARSGNASVAITALSLVIADKTDPYVVVPQSDYPPIAQAAAVVRGTKDPSGARKFMAFLTSPAANDIWKRYGYGLPR